MIQKEKIDYAPLIIVIIFLLIVAYFYWNSSDVRENGVVTFGTIVNCYSSGEADVTIIYEFRVNGILYRRSLEAPMYLRGCAKRKDCISEKYVVKYIVSNPHRNTILFESPVTDTIVNIKATHKIN